MENRSLELTVERLEKGEPMCEESYEKSARIWDLFTGDRTEEIAYWSHRIRPYGKKVLVLMSATGAVAAGLAEKGFLVTAVDRSQEMLKTGAVQFKAIPWLDFVEGDVLTLDLRTRFDFVFIGSSSFHHFLREEERSKALAIMNKHLRVGGGLGLELWYPSTHSFSYPPREFSPIKRTSLRVSKRASTSYDEKTKRVHIDQEVYLEEERFSHTFDMQLFSQSELSSMLDTTGFQLLKEEGNYQGDSFHENAPKWLVLARKKEV